ncbi:MULTISPECIES: alpha/beta fold hydrolase [Halorussus]|uniref:alpha/beta fold hydrolase n=1 Tax=Halorussus TaxID=1070314 RepID=UPI000E20F781|nr:MULTISPECIES: alpha/beta hydrolase [Halorussus]NHN57841.1 alpha/beta hydrolase [Halorussus sp. JP-T4]
MSNQTAETALRGVDVAGPAAAQPVVFVHGVLFTRKMWTPQRAALAGDYRVVVPDLPGHGALADEEFALERALRRVDEVVEAAAGGRATVVGLSLGGYVATAYARRHPEKVDALVAAGSSANPVGVLEPLTRAVSAASETVTESRLANQAVEALARYWVKRRDLDADVKREILASGFYPRQFGNAGFDLAGVDFRSAFGSFPGPALVLNGQWDLLNRLGEDEHVLAAPDARLRVIEGAGHVSNLERPAAFVDAVERFALDR